ncbi:MAG: orotidine-5'-phosphate decarboxylase [Candidatus Omnitrophica bacterium]|nr:orotidine-5'-phosphate decarboxylase [Candidatus Omnitrophota bacterium]
MKKDPRLIVALDVDSYRKAVRLLKSLSRYVKVFKVGSALFTKCGPKIIRHIHKRGAKVFLDLKFNDIPTTVSNAAVEATKLGVYMLNVHALSGKEAMKVTAEAVAKQAKKLHIFKPILVAVTILTSLHEEDLSPLGIKGEVKELVLRLAKAAKESGLDGVVASAKETHMIKEKFGDDFVVVTPGIRPEWASERADQKRIMTPKEAIKNGSDFVVIGRPIIKARKPVKAVKEILEEIGS